MILGEGRNMGLRAMLGVIFVVSFWSESHELSYDFYERTCPQVEDIVRAGVESISLTDPSTPAALLRLMFHDCQVQGCDASILIDQNDPTMPSEMASPKNFGIRKREKISLIKSMVEAVCPQQVSCADILILAAREAVAISGGPRVTVPLGRRDSSSPPSYKLADSMLPPANLGVDGMLQIFAHKGMNMEESVAILGAHTLGITHCHSLPSHHLSNTQVPMDPALALMLSLGCPLGSHTPNTSFVLNDPTTLIFDNLYFANAISGRGILRVDSELPLDPRTGPFVEHFAGDQNGFFTAFSSAFVKLSSSGVLTGNEGVIRASCDTI
ncbi:Peroxidase [Actinidia chinensis var. chinensis]|uniref:Peroxidase n=1 Tax=Actinidia chinensis var. chinensis TaxID=1590841 RepID=A0A2R6P470_ACTCC|nr:Peroxidase [Actinidia chinensis var. chinensis]